MLQRYFFKISSIFILLGVGLFGVAWFITEPFVIAIISFSVAILTYEALRQNGFPGLTGTGEMAE